MYEKIKLLIVDDDEEVVESLSMSLTLQFPYFEFFASNNGKSALELIHNKHPEIVISDIHMPLMDGLELTKNIRESDTAKDIYIILFTGFTEHDDVKKVFDCGVDDYLTKPFKVEELNARLKAAVRIVELQKNLKDDNLRLIQLTDILSKDLEDMKKIACKLVQARVPALYSMFDKIAFASKWIAKSLTKFTDDQIRDIELTAYLSYTGKLFLPDLLINQPIMNDGLITNELMYQVPHKGKEILNSVAKLSGCAEIIYSLYENFDGTGIPEKLKSWQIPAGARIVRLVLDFYELIYISNYSINEAINFIKKHSNRLYDNKLVILLNQYIEIAERTDEEYQNQSLKEFELLPGMELACDVNTMSGFKLISAGTILTDNLIKKIISHATTDPLIGNTIVKIKKK